MTKTKACNYYSQIIHIESIIISNYWQQEDQTQTHEAKLAKSLKQCTTMVTFTRKVTRSYGRHLEEIKLNYQVQIEHM